MKEVERTRGGEILTVKPHYSQLRGGKVLLEIADEFGHDDPKLYRKIARFPSQRGSALKIVAGTTGLAVVLGGVVWLGWTDRPPDSANAVDNSSTVKTREVLNDPNKLRALGICSIELQKQANLTQYLHMVGISTQNMVTATEYEAAAQLAVTNGVACQSQIASAGPDMDVSASIVQFDVARACADVAYYATAVPSIENQKMIALNRELAIASGQKC